MTVQTVVYRLSVGSDSDTAVLTVNIGEDMGGGVLTTSTSVVEPGGSVDAIITGGPAGVTNHVALYEASESNPDNAIDYFYLNGEKEPPAVGLANATVTFSVPETEGNYVFKLWENDAAPYSLIDTANVFVGIEYITSPADHGWFAGANTTVTANAINASIADASANAPSGGYGVVELLPSTTYVVTGSRIANPNRNPGGCVTITSSNVWIRTAGQPTGATRAVIKMDNVFTGGSNSINSLCVVAIRYPAANVKLSHLTVDGSREYMNIAAFDPAGVASGCGDDGLMHCIHVAGSDNVNLEWVEAKQGVVDGLTIDAYLPLQAPSANRPVATTFSATDCDFHHNRRQACSIVNFGTLMAYDKCYFLRCKFRNTGNSADNVGQIPGYGIDVEPNAGPVRAWGLTLDDCDVINNGPVNGHHENLSYGTNYVRGVGFHTNAFNQIGNDQHYFKVINSRFNGNATWDNGDLCIILNQNADRSDPGESHMTNVLFQNNVVQKSIYVEGFQSDVADRKSTLTQCTISNNTVGTGIIFRTFKSTGNSITGSGNVITGGVTTNGIQTITVS